jgi:hypothetical protein
MTSSGSGHLRLRSYGNAWRHICSGRLPISSIPKTLSRQKKRSCFESSSRNSGSYRPAIIQLGILSTSSLRADSRIRSLFNAAKPIFSNWIEVHVFSLCEIQFLRTVQHCTKHNKNSTQNTSSIVERSITAHLVISLIHDLMLVRRTDYTVKTIWYIIVISVHTTCHRERQCVSCSLYESSACVRVEESM